MGFESEGSIKSIHRRLRSVKSFRNLFKVRDRSISDSSTSTNSTTNDSNSVRPITTSLGGDTESKSESKSNPKAKAISMGQTESEPGSLHPKAHESTDLNQDVSGRSQHVSLERTRKSVPSASNLKSNKAKAFPLQCLLISYQNSDYLCVLKMFKGYESQFQIYYQDIPNQIIVKFKSEVFQLNFLNFHYQFRNVRHITMELLFYLSESTTVMIHTHALMRIFKQFNMYQDSIEKKGRKVIIVKTIPRYFHQEELYDYFQSFGSVISIGYVKKFCNRLYQSVAVQYSHSEDILQIQQQIYQDNLKEG